MAKQNTTKKHIVTSFHNLAPELQDSVKEKYPLGFTDAMIRVDKPNGDFFYAVPFDTDEIAYLVKIDVKIDDNSTMTTTRIITTTKSRVPTKSRTTAAPTAAATTPTTT